MPIPELTRNTMISQAWVTWPLLVPWNLVKSTQIMWSENGAGKNCRCLLHHAKGFKLYPKDKGNHEGLQAGQWNDEVFISEKPM